MKIQHPKDRNDGKNDFLCRYLSLPKFIDLYFNKKLHFTRLDFFEDNLEGITAAGANLRRWLSDPPLTEENLNVDIPKELIQWEADLRTAHDQEFRLSQTSQFASCWFESERESIAMWRLYSDRNGLMLRFRKSEIIKIVTIAAEAYESEIFVEMCYDSISYKKLNPFDPKEKFQNKFNGLKKDIAYEHEKEFRFIVLCNSSEAGRHCSFQLPIGALTDFEFLEIYTNPYIRDWEFPNMKNLMALFGLESKLNKSHIDVKIH